MPNIWSTTYQKITEIISGPRTKDTEFEAKVEELKILEKALNHIKNIFPNFAKNTQGIRYMCREICIYLPNLFEEGNIYFPLVKDVLDIHQQVDKNYEEMVMNITNLQKHTIEWDKLFEEAKINIIQRETLRRIYDHYDEKFEKLVKTRNDKSQKNIPESKNETERFDRNEGKYKKASEDYVKISGFTYNLICELIEFRNNIINPILFEYIKEEKKFFTSVSDLFKKFDKMQSIINNIERQYKKPVNNYNPVKYIRGGKLLEGDKLNYEKPKINVPIMNTNQTNFTYEDYKNSIKQGHSKSVIEKEEKKNIDTFSYENYINQRGGNSKIDTGSSNVDYVLDSMMKPKSNTVHANYLNFNLNEEVKPNDIRNTVYIEDKNLDIVNPYSNLSFGDIKPVYSGLSNLNKSIGNNNFHNPYEQKPNITNNQFGNSSQFNNMSNQYGQFNNMSNQFNNMSNQFNNINNQFGNLNMGNNNFNDMNYPPINNNMKYPK